ncbi:MAG: SsrA-binding protein SmpB [Desulfobacteraceae bacterium]
MSYRVVCQNRKASHEYFLEERFEAGLVLEGPEVKSLRDGRANLVDSYAKIKNGEAWLYSMHISPYPHARHVSQDPTRTRKLLLTRRELKRLLGKTQERGYSLIPLKVYFSGNWAKVELALARGKRKVDKRRSLKEKEIKREMDQAKKDKGH